MSHLASATSKAVRMFCAPTVVGPLGSGFREFDAESFTSYCGVGCG